MKQSLGPNATLIGHRKSREQLATPALLLDLDDLEHNLSQMMMLCRKAGLALRPHAKTHKSSQVAKWQIAAGAIGICVATLREASVMVDAGVPGVLLTSPLVGAAKIARFIELTARATGLMVVVDNHESVIALAARLRRAGQQATVLVDVDIGMHRTGVVDGAGVVALVRQIQASENLIFAGIQAYSGAIQHIPRVTDRTRIYGKHLHHLQTVLRDLQHAGIQPRIVSGGGTGSFAIDRRAGLFTESQCGSYALMDREYEDVQLFARGANPYKTALLVQCVVSSNNHRGFATIDGGFKCFHVNGPLPKPVSGVPKGTTYQFFGDEFGKLILARKSSSLKLGVKVELVTPHCDPTVNLHSYYHCVRGKKLVAIWPVDARGPL